MANNDPHFQREKKKYQNPIASRELILSIITNHGTAIGFSHLAKLCNIHDDTMRLALKKRLRAMEREGQLFYNKHSQYEIPDQSQFIEGTIIGHRDGFGFLQPDNSKPGKNDWYVSHSQMRSYIHGDRVKAQAIGEFKGKTEARIMQLVESRTAPIVGRYFKEQGINIVVPDDSRISQEIVIPQGKNNGARHGQMVVANIVERPSKRGSAIGEVESVLGEHMAPGMEIEIALRQYDIPFQWPKAVTKEAKKLAPEVEESDKLNRVDLRHLPLVTIDGESSRDFDDAVYCERKKSGGWRLYVAIADVSHYVTKNSALDQEAVNRGNSVYFPDQVIPMLPENISNGLCSLNPEVDRLCMVCEMTIAESGKLSGFKFYQAVMHSHARLTYTKVAAMLDGDETVQQRYSKLLPHIVDLYELYQQLKQVRSERGAFEFDTIEPKFIFNAERKIDYVETVERNDAHKIIEECMILANVAAAKFIEKHQGHALFRVHDKPDPSKLASFRSFLAELGGELTFSNEPSPKELSEQVNRYMSRPDSELIQTMMIRSMRQAVYQQDNIGHFGLALEGYAHFTSPIRRYPDLILHRAIKAILAKQKQPVTGHYAYDEEELDILGEQCSMTERRADDATRDVENSLKCEFMLDHLNQEYTGVISSVTSFGLFVRLVDLHIEGLVHITGLGNDYFQYDNERHILIGERTRKVYRLGDELSVSVVSVDMDSKQIDFALPEYADNRRPNKESAGGRKKANQHRTESTAMSIREQLKTGALGGKSDSKKKPSSKSAKKKSTDKNKADKKSAKRKPKSRAAKRIAAKKGKKATGSKPSKRK